MFEFPKFTTALATIWKIWVKYEKYLLAIKKLILMISRKQVRCTNFSNRGHFFSHPVSYESCITGIC